MQSAWVNRIYLEYKTFIGKLFILIKRHRALIPLDYQINIIQKLKLMAPNEYKKIDNPNFGDLVNISKVSDALIG